MALSSLLSMPTEFMGRDLASFTINGGGSGFVMTSYESYDSSDPGNNYQRTQTVQFGPGGVLEMREQERDGRRRTERIGMRRQLGDQYAQLERSRREDTGEERSRQTLHNVEQEDLERFDERWLAAATRSLPTYSNRSTLPRVEAAASHSRPTLPPPDEHASGPLKVAPPTVQQRRQTAATVGPRVATESQGADGGVLHTIRQKASEWWTWLKGEPARSEVKCTRATGKRHHH